MFAHASHNLAVKGTCRAKWCQVRKWERVLLRRLAGIMRDRECRCNASSRRFTCICRLTRSRTYITWNFLTTCSRLESVVKNSWTLFKIVMFRPIKRNKLVFSQSGFQCLNISKWIYIRIQFCKSRSFSFLKQWTGLVWIRLISYILNW